MRSLSPPGCARHCAGSPRRGDSCHPRATSSDLGAHGGEELGMGAVTDVAGGERTAIGVPSGALLFDFMLVPPVAHSDRVQRPRLTTRLAESNERLVLVVAPAGYGKTTLAVHWRELDDRPFAWVTLGSGMDDRRALWTAIVESVARAEPTFASTAERVESWLAAAEPSRDGSSGRKGVRADRRRDRRRPRRLPLRQRLSVRRVDRLVRRAHASSGPARDRLPTGSRSRSRSAPCERGSARAAGQRSRSFSRGGRRDSERDHGTRSHA